jgi:hypothetical protein
VSDDPDANKNSAESTNPSSEEGQKPASGEEASIFKLRQSLAGEEQEQEKLPQKTGFLQRVTDALHLRPAIDRETGQLSPVEEKGTRVNQQVESPHDTQQENIPGADASTAPSETEETMTGEIDQKSPWEGSIFDMLAQIQKGGLGKEELPEADTPVSEPLSSGTEVNQLSGPESEITLPPSPGQETGPQPAIGGLTHQDDEMTTSSLASRLWGLEELSSDLDRFPPAEPKTTPFLDETAEVEPQEREEKRSFFDRRKGQHSDEKDTKPLQIDDNEVMDRIMRTAGALHEPPASLMPGRSSRGSRTQPDLPEEKESPEASRFTYYPQEEAEEAPNLPGGPAVDTNVVSPSVKEPPANQPTPDAGKKEDALPISSPGEGRVPPEAPAEGIPVLSGNPPYIEETPPAWGKPLDFDQLLAVSRPEVQPEQEETTPAKEESWHDSNLDDIRSIALAQPDEEETAALPSPEVLPEEETPASSEPKTPKKQGSWWASLSTFEKILLGITGLLIASIAVIAVLTASIFGPHNPAGTIQPTITPSELPHPSSIILPGGWSFPLQGSTLVTPLTVPGSGAWLEGSEVRRVVEIPWNKQSEAVAHSLVPGDPIQLVFDDNTKIIYKVQQVLRVSATDTSILTDVKPSLAIILSGENADKRWVIIATP